MKLTIQRLRTSIIDYHFNLNRLAKDTWSAYPRSFNRLGMAHFTTEPKYQLIDRASSSVKNHERKALVMQVSYRAHVHKLINSYSEWSLSRTNTQVYKPLVDRAKPHLFIGNPIP